MPTMPTADRTQKTVDGVTHTYYTLNGKLMRESFPYSDTTIIMDFKCRKGNQQAFGC